MQRMQITTFLALLRPIFTLKQKYPPIGIGSENVSTLTLDLKRIPSQKSIPAWVKTFFFGLHLISRTKPVQIWVKTFFLVFI